MLTAQSIHQPQLHIRKAEGQILLDGLLDEKDWSLAEGTSHFYQIFPTDTAIARSNTVVKLTYDDEFLYVGFPGKLGLPMIPLFLRIQGTAERWNVRWPSAAI